MGKDMVFKNVAKQSHFTLENQNGKTENFRDVDVEDYLADMFEDPDQFVILTAPEPRHKVRYVQACVQDEGNRSQFYIVAVPQDSVTKKAAQALTEAGVRQSVADGYTAVGGAPELDNLDTVFGQVYAGMDVVDAIAASKEAVTVESVTVGTYAAPPVQGDWEEVPTRGRRPLDSCQRGAAPLESYPGRGI